MSQKQRISIFASDIDSLMILCSYLLRLGISGRNKEIEASRLFSKKI